jgi:hypothetical protein
MEIQQWIGLIGVIAYWIFRAYTASKKASKNKPPVLKTPSPKGEYAPRTEQPKPWEPMVPSKPSETPSLPWESAERAWKYEEEPLQTKVFSYEDEGVLEQAAPKKNRGLPSVETEAPKLKFKGFNGRDAVIYQAIMNRPEY